MLHDDMQQQAVDSLLCESIKEEAAFPFVFQQTFVKTADGAAPDDGDTVLLQPLKYRAFQQQFAGSFVGNGADTVGEGSRNYGDSDRPS